MQNHNLPCRSVRLPDQGRLKPATTLVSWADMDTRRLVVIGALASAIVAALMAAIPRAATTLPAHLTDSEFWQLSTDASEPDGYFRSDNLTSNETGFLRVVPDLVSRTKPGQVYLGVGPEQNFSYIAATRPALAIIFDIRRGNLLVQLMYKAIFELTRDRGDFVSMLFSRPRPEKLSADSSVTDLFAAFGPVGGDEALYERNLKAILDRLVKFHGLPLTPREQDGLARIYRVFFDRGAAIRFSPTYVDLMTATDDAGAFRSYLATSASFAFLRELEANNLIVPVVGDFAGPRAIRSVGGYLKSHGATVSAFYLSNVEQYLYQDGKWAAFCRNVAALPLDGTSTFIRSTSGRGAGFGVGFVSSLGAMAAETRSCPA